MKTLRWDKYYDITLKIAWALLFITLPVTNFPYFPGGIGGKTLVRPLAIYPLCLVLILATLPRLFKRPLPKTFLPLFAFSVVALISSVFAFTAEQEALRGVTMGSRFFRNMATLGIGGAFYLSIALLPENWEQLKFSLRWLYIGFGLALFWGTLQIVYVIHHSPKYFKWISQIQSFISTRKLFTTRISGPTYEPKWFAEQICILLLPWLLAAVLSRRSLFKWRCKWLTVEWLLLGWAAVIIVFTYSRTGLFILAVLVVSSFLLFRFSIPVHSGKRSQKAPLKSNRRRLPGLLEVILVTITVITVLILLGSQNPYFSRFWRYWTEDKNWKRTYLEYIAFQQRFVYLDTALRIYDAHPVLGVGLGNYAFYFEEMLPDQPWYRQPEIVRQITPVEGRDRLITPKNLLARLLAETGLAGAITFTTFVLAIVGCVLFLWFSPTSEQRYWGIGGLLGIVVFALATFSFDSFALPNMWALFGLITAAAHLPTPFQCRAGA